MLRAASAPGGKRLPGLNDPEVGQQNNQLAELKLGKRTLLVAGPRARQACNAAMPDEFTSRFSKKKLAEDSKCNDELHKNKGKHLPFDAKAGEIGKKEFSQETVSSRQRAAPSKLHEVDLSEQDASLMKESLTKLSNEFVRGGKLTAELVHSLNKGSANLRRGEEKAAMETVMKVGEMVREAMDLKSEILALREENHKLSCQCAVERGVSESLRKDLAELQSLYDNLKLKYETTNASDKQKGMDLMAERRRNDEISRQLRDMCENLLCIMDTGEHKIEDSANLRKRCFKLVRQNTTLSGQVHLLQRQRRWAQAKSKVLRDELTRVYLGVLGEHVKSPKEIEDNTEEFFHDQMMKLKHKQKKKDVSADADMELRQMDIYKPLLWKNELHYEAVVDFLTHLNHTGGEDLEEFLQSPQVYSEEIRNVCLKGLGCEFFAQWQRSQAMLQLIAYVERLVNLTETENAIQKFVTAIQELLCCDQATLWIVDRVRKLMWTRVREHRKGAAEDMITLQMPLPNDGEKMDAKGLVAASYITRDIINVQDAHKDKRFNRQADLATGYRTKSVLCMPIIRNSRVRLVLQAVNKLDQKGFDHNGEFVLRLLGHVALEVLEVSETSSGSSTDSKRKDMLMQLAGDMMSECSSPTELLIFFERGLKELFKAEAVSVHLIYGDFSKQLKLVNSRKRTQEEVNQEGFSGLVGHAVKGRTPHAISTADINDNGEKYRLGVDLPIPMQFVAQGPNQPAPQTAILHTVPFFDVKAGNSPSTVIQFLCIEKERKSFGDDGTYSQYNHGHVRLLSQMMVYVHSQLERWFPVMERLTTTSGIGTKKLRKVKAVSRMIGTKGSLRGSQGESEAASVSVMESSYMLSTAPRQTSVVHNLDGSHPLGETTSLPVGAIEFSDQGRGEVWFDEDEDEELVDSAS